jgi:ADP-ribosyl-[dinitrogen reductase] hydrolase
MVAARLLVEMGAHPDEAISAVRRGRGPGAIETPAQENWVRSGRQRSEPSGQDQAATRDRAIGALLGLAVGDAVGTTIEFSAKPSRAVLFDMVGGGPFGLQAGQWTDDTAMALALADSLLADAALDAADLIRRFVSWYRDGAYSCTGECFDIGNTTVAALRRFERTGDPVAGAIDPSTAGNGSIMRLAPVAIRHWRDRETMLRVARDQSRTTHGAVEAIEACEILAELLAAGIRGSCIRDLVGSGPARRVRGFRLGQPRTEVRGTGYVVASLHAALWAVSRTSSFRDAVLLAANLGEDADTTAAVAGQIAGVLYGASAIPAEWLGHLAWRERIERSASLLFDAGKEHAMQNNSSLARECPDLPLINSSREADGSASPLSPVAIERSDIREQLVSTALAWQERFGIAPSITSAVSEYDAAITLLKMTEAELSESQKLATAVQRGYDFKREKTRYQVKANRPSGRPGSFVTLCAKAKNYDWDVLIWILYDKNYNIIEAWSWDVDSYKDAFHDKKRIAPSDMRQGVTMVSGPLLDERR